MAKRKQLNIEGMLVKKFKKNVGKQQEKEELQKDNNVTFYMLKKNDITDEKVKYEVSTMAKCYFREHSNFEEIMNLYIQKEKKSPDSKEKYVNSLIRNLISAKRFVQYYPFNMFKFESVHHETIAKLLVTYPRITNEEHLKDVHAYFARESVQYCQVSLTLDNRLWPIEKKYLDEKQKKHGYENLPDYLSKATHEALRNYYEEKGITEDVDFEDITVEEMCEISNFSDAVRHYMKENDIPMTEFDATSEQVLQAMKDNRELVVIGITGFRVKPRYNLISNNITPEQAKIIARKKQYFYEYTNAKILVTLNKHKTPLNEELGFVEMRRIRRDNFFLKYVRTPHDKKKKFPFHNLCVLRKHENFEVRYQQPATTNNPQEPQPSTSNLWKNKNVSKKNEEIAASKMGQTNTSSKHLAQITNQNWFEQTTSEGTNNPQKKQRDMEEYLGVPNFPPEFNQVITLLANRVDVVKGLKQDLKERDEAFFNTYWKKNKMSITCNYIYFSLIDRHEKFLSIVQSSTDSLVRSCLDSLNIPLNYDHFEGDDFITSTQTHLEELIPLNDENVNTDNQQNVLPVRPFQNPSNSSEDIVDINRVDKNPVLVITSPVPPAFAVKQEPLSESLNAFKDSDVVYVSPVLEILTISDDEEKIAARQPTDSEQSKRVDRFWQELRKDSQDEENLSEDPHGLGSEYNLIMYERARKNAARKLVPKKTTSVRSDLKSKINFIDEGSNTDSGNNENNGNTDQAELNNFSLFFSTQLMLDYASNVAAAKSMSFVKSLSSINSTFYNQHFGHVSFNSRIERVIYCRDRGLQISINLPQFSLYNVSLRTCESIKQALNINEQDWLVLCKNIGFLESYSFNEYINGEKQSQFEFTVKKFLNLYFSTLSHFKCFRFYEISNNNDIECDNLVMNNKIDKTDVTRSIDSNILEKIKSFNR